MANWSPAEINLDTRPDPGTAAALAEHLARDHPLLPQDCTDADDIREALLGGLWLAWEDMGTATFSPAAEALLRERGIGYDLTLRDGLGGPGETRSWYPGGGETVETFDGDFEEE